MRKKKDSVSTSAHFRVDSPTNEEDHAENECSPSGSDWTRTVVLGYRSVLIGIASVSAQFPLSSLFRHKIARSRLVNLLRLRSSCHHTSGSTHFCVGRARVQKYKSQRGAGVEPTHLSVLSKIQMVIRCTIIFLKVLSLALLTSSSV